MSSSGLQITPPTDLGVSQYAWSFEVVTTQKQHVPSAIVRDANKALKGTKKVDLDGNASAENPAVEPFVVEGADLIVESASELDAFNKIPLPKASTAKVTSNQKTKNQSLASLTDGRIEDGFGPIFPNGIRNGAYKMDLGSSQSVTAISSWSFRKSKTRGKQKLVVYGSNADSDPGWDLSKYSRLGTVDTSKSKGQFTAASIRATGGKSLGKYRWIVWAVSPVSEAGGGENTAFQELNVE